ncbi:hypothetical protein MHYP_G00348140 [Metynnis hypsauchen]
MYTLSGPHHQASVEEFELDGSDAPQLDVIGGLMLMLLRKEANAELSVKREDRKCSDDADHTVAHLHTRSHVCRRIAAFASSVLSSSAAAKVYR